MNFSNNYSHAFVQLLDNSTFAWALIACGIAQLSKLFVELVRDKRWRPEVLLETGGMPSSHSALVTGAAAGVGLEMGFDHPVFAVAATLSLVVMYDASGVRRSAGFIAQRVNLLSEQSGNNKLGPQLKESLGHSRLQVLIGGLIGPAIVFPGMVLFGSPLHLIKMIGLIIV